MADDFMEISKVPQYLDLDFEERFCSLLFREVSAWGLRPMELNLSEVNVSLDRE